MPIGEFTRKESSLRESNGTINDKIHNAISEVSKGFNKKIEQDCHPRNTSDGSRQGSYLLIESLLILSQVKLSLILCVTRLN